MKYIILAISFILDGILTNYLPFMVGDLSLFTPLFTLVSLVIIYPFYHHQEKKYFITIIVLGILYDLFYTNLFLCHGIIFLLLGILIHFVIKYIGINFIKISLIITSIIIVYELLMVLFILLFNLVPISFSGVLYKISHSLLLNIIYGELLYLLLKTTSKKYMHKSIN